MDWYSQGRRVGSKQQEGTNATTGYLYTRRTKYVSETSHSRQQGRRQIKTWTEERTAYFFLCLSLLGSSSSRVSAYNERPGSLSVDFLTKKVKLLPGAVPCSYSALESWGKRRKSRAPETQKYKGVSQAHDDHWCVCGSLDWGNIEWCNCATRELHERGSDVVSSYLICTSYVPALARVRTCVCTWCWKT